MSLKHKEQWRSVLEAQRFRFAIIAFSSLQRKPPVDLLTPRLRPLPSHKSPSLMGLFRHREPIVPPKYLRINTRDPDSYSHSLSFLYPPTQGSTPRRHETPFRRTNSKGRAQRFSESKNQGGTSVARFFLFFFPFRKKEYILCVYTNLHLLLSDQETRSGQLFRKSPPPSIET